MKTVGPSWEVAKVSSSLVQIWIPDSFWSMSRAHHGTVACGRAVLIVVGFVSDVEAC